MLWLYKGEPGIHSFQMIPSGFISLLYILPYSYYTYQETEHGVLLAFESMGIVVISCVLSTIIFPFIIRFFDTINIPLGFDLYKTSQKRIEKQ